MGEAEPCMAGGGCIQFITFCNERYHVALKIAEHIIGAPEKMQVVFTLP